MNNNERVANLERVIAEGRLLAGGWSSPQGDGKPPMLCALSALAPECEMEGDADLCPPDLMPRWMAHLVVAMNDGCSDEARGRIMMALAACVRRWHVLTAEDLRRLEAMAKWIILSAFDCDDDIKYEAMRLLGAQARGEVVSEAWRRELCAKTRRLVAHKDTARRSARRWKQ
jgi:hypothetical protein